MHKKSTINEIIHKLNLELQATGKQLCCDEYRQLSLQTTNKIFLVGDYIFKNYTSEQAYQAELSVYSNRSLFSFKTADIISYYQDSNGEFWLIMDYIQGVTLSDYLLSNKLSSLDYQNCIRSVTESLGEFESKASKLPDIGINKPNFSELIDPLFDLLEQRQYSTGIDSLKISILKANEFIQNFPPVPYFDCSLRNIIVPQSSLDKADIFNQLVYIDFDKSYRSTIIAEQLSHLLLDNSLRDYKEIIFLTYSQVCGIDLSLIEEVIPACIFIRSLSWLRYSLQWMRDFDNNHEAKTVINMARSALIGALNILEDCSLSIGISKTHKNSILCLLLTVYLKI